MHNVKTMLIQKHERAGHKTCYCIIILTFSKHSLVIVLEIIFLL